MSILDLNGIIKYLDELDSCREKLIKMSRDIIRYSKKLIHNIQQEEYGASRRILEKMMILKKDFMRIASKNSRLYHSNLVYDALTEYVESYTVYSIVLEERIPSFRDLEVEPIPYLLGLLEAMGELRRLALEYVRRGNLNRADKLLDFMEHVYMELSILNYPDSILPGFRRKCDLVRRMIDDTKNIIVFARGCENVRKLLKG